MAISTLTTNPTTVQRVDLPAPRKSGGMPLFTALSQRRSVRKFASE